MLAFGQTGGGGLCTGSWHFHVTTITDQWSPRGHVMSSLSQAVWWIKQEKVSLDIIQVVSVPCLLLWFFTGLSYNVGRFHSQSRRGTYSRDKNTCAENLAENGRGAYVQGGGRRMGGILWYIYMYSTCTVHVTCVGTCTCILCMIVASYVVSLCVCR